MSQESRFCHKCGAPLPAGSGFCPKCGAPVAGQQPPAPSQPAPQSAPAPSSTYQRREKREKEEKREKNEKNEKGRGGDLAGAITGGLVLILLGILFYLSQSGLAPIDWSNWWQYFLVGMGVILMVQGVVRYAERKHAYPGNFIGGAVLIVIGAAFLSSANYSLWPLVLVVLGVGAIASAFIARRRVRIT